MNGRDSVIKESYAGRMLRNWWPIIVCFIGLWWGIQQGITELNTSQKLILQKIEHLDAEVNGLKENLASLETNMNDLQKQIYLHEHKNGQS